LLLLALLWLHLPCRPLLTLLLLLPLLLLVASPVVACSAV
jgi:hypothetical protein